MIGGPAPTPNLLRQWELGKVPKAMADEHDAADRPRDPGTKGRKKKRTRRRGLRFWRQR